MYDHVKGLVERGHTVECFRPPVSNPEWLAMPTIEHEIPLTLFGDEQSYVKRIWKHMMRLTLGMKAMKEHSLLAAEAINKGGFDVLFANTCSAYHAPFVGRHTTIPSVLYLQEPNRFLYEALPYLPWVGAPEGSSWRRKLRAVFDMFALRKQAQEELKNAKSYERILVNSYFSRESVARAYGLDSQVCYLGIDTDRYRPADVPREDFVLGVGAIATPKRIDLAMRAIGCIEPSRRPKLLWASNSVDEPYLASLRTLADELRVDFDLRVLVPDEEVVSLLRRAACVVYTPRLEPFGYVPLEAAACGTPVVTIAEGGVRETMANGFGWIADPAPTEIASAIEDVLTDPTIASAKILDKRDDLVAKWNNTLAIDRLERHLRQIADSRLT